MQQLGQKLKNGQMEILEVPVPNLQRGCLLIKNHFSLISAGTEASTVKAARKGYIGKAKERPQQVKQVFDALKSQGITQTYRAVMKKLDAYSALGYSCAGEVIDMAPDVTEFQIGDLVACGGFSANHSEVVCVPKNLTVKLEPDADMQQATYNTLGAIAMQGVRQANLQLGETCAVIGLGLLGQLTALLLKAAGVKVVGIDIDPSMVKLAKDHWASLALPRNEGGIEEKILRFSGGMGCDSVIITAASSSLDPINFAGAIARKRGTVVVVGAVPTGFDREPHYYKKELQLKMSCSYGPGRYDPIYEEKNIDYPSAYVRWTERRNMQAFQELIASGKIDLGYLTTHRFKLDEAANAYDMIMERSEPFIGIVIEYDVSKEHRAGKILIHAPKGPHSPQANIGIGFIGAGSYAQSHLLPNIPKSDKRFKRVGVMTSTSTSSRSVAERFGFEFCTGTDNDIFENESINTIFIASRHSSHAGYVMKALQSGKNVFVEKPLCLTEEELSQITGIYNATLSSHQRLPHLLVGYNRRFSPLAQEIKQLLGSGPMAMNYRVNAGFIPQDSWIQDLEIGGGRLIGEVCHFIDFLIFLNGSLPISVYSTVLRDGKGNNDTLSLSLSFQNGSIGTICYFANGDKSLPKEQVEIFSDGCVAVLNDYKSLSIHANGKKKESRHISQDKGQAKEVELFLAAVLEGKGQVIPFEEMYATSLCTLKALESMQKGSAIHL